MRKIILSLLLLLSLNAFAQDEMDTTFVVKPSGDTIGIIHRRGETPDISKYVVRENAEASASIKRSLNADSIEFYQALADQHYILGNSLRSKGRGMMVGGGVGFGLGFTLMLLGSLDTETDYYGDESLTGSGKAMVVIGGGMLVTMPVVFIAGIVMKSVGNHKLRRASYYSNKVRYFQGLDQYFSSVKFSPVINPVTGAVGGSLALGF